MPIRWTFLVMIGFASPLTGCGDGSSFGEAHGAAGTGGVAGDAGDEDADGPWECIEGNVAGLKENGYRALQPGAMQARHRLSVRVLE